MIFDHNGFLQKSEIDIYWNDAKHPAFYIHELVFHAVLF